MNLNAPTFVPNIGGLSAIDMSSFPTLAAGGLNLENAVKNFNIDALEFKPVKATVTAGPLPTFTPTAQF